MVMSQLYLVAYELMLDKQVNLLLKHDYWLNCGINSFAIDYNLACGEMESGKIWKVGHNYKVGEYKIVWRTMDSKTVKITYIYKMSGLITNELTKEDIP